MPCTYAAWALRASAASPRRAATATAPATESLAAPAAGAGSPAGSSRPVYARGEHAAEQGDAERRRRPAAASSSARCPSRTGPAAARRARRPSPAPARARRRSRPTASQVGGAARTRRRAAVVAPSASAAGDDSEPDRDRDPGADARRRSGRPRRRPTHQAAHHRQQPHARCRARRAPCTAWKYCGIVNSRPNSPNVPMVAATVPHRNRGRPNRPRSIIGYGAPTLPDHERDQQRQPDRQRGPAPAARTSRAAAPRSRRTRPATRPAVESSAAEPVDRARPAGRATPG